MSVPGGAVLRRVVLEGLGWVLVLAGVAALVLPGPGLLGIFAGLFLLSQQYEWAERRLAPVKLRALRGAAESVESTGRTIGSVAGVVVLEAAGVLWIADPPVPSWWFFADSWWLPGGVWTGVTQIASGVIALALIVYSFRRFHGKPEALTALEQEIATSDANDGIGDQTEARSVGTPTDPSA